MSLHETQKLKLLMSTTKLEYFRLQSQKSSVANTIVITPQSNQLLSCLLFLIDNLQTIQVTCSANTGSLSLKFYGEATFVHLLEKKQVQYYSVCTHIFMEHTKLRQVIKVRELNPLNFNDNRLKYCEVK